MRNKLAKAIKKSVYGDDSLKNRKYQVMSNGELRADPKRQVYQQLKKVRRIAA
jgi:hypothetical protein